LAAPAIAFQVICCIRCRLLVDLMALRQHLPKVTAVTVRLTT
jgi:hypothetical protein